MGLIVTEASHCRLELVNQQHMRLFDWQGGISQGLSLVSAIAYRPPRRGRQNQDRHGHESVADGQTSSIRPEPVLVVHLARSAYGFIGRVRICERSGTTVIERTEYDSRFGVCQISVAGELKEAVCFVLVGQHAEPVQAPDKGNAPRSRIEGTVSFLQPAQRGRVQYATEIAGGFVEYIDPFEGRAIIGIYIADEKREPFDELALGQTGLLAAIAQPRSPRRAIWHRRAHGAITVQYSMEHALRVSMASRAMAAVPSLPQKLDDEIFQIV